MNQEKFNKYRKEYPNFIYDSYEVIDNIDSLKIVYHFNIEGLTPFNPSYLIDKKYIKNKNINKDLFNYLVFHIGLIELVSYFKCTCSPNVIIKAGYINEDQIKWFKKLYYYGLGEMLYTNGINVSEEELMNITVMSDKKIFENVEYSGIGNLIPIGGGKDSNVSLELMKDEFDINTCFILNPKEIHEKCASTAGYSEDDTFIVKRFLDKKLIELNGEGFLNGHTPFSSLVAFVTYLCAYLSNKKYIILSNEASANEPTIIGTKINHQYSKTYEFENDFNEYTKKYFNIDIKYFSLLRCLNEFQIGMLFSNYKKYHDIFKSCNVGSKSVPWKWCCNCAKCMFVYIILSPFLYKEELVNIFGEDLFEKKELLNTLLELSGNSETKPFECVGTYGEVRYALSLIINKLGDDLPYLLKYYKDNFDLTTDIKYEDEFNEENNLDEKFVDIVKEELKKVKKLV